MIKAIIFDYGNVVGTNPNKFIFHSLSKKFNIEYEKLVRKARKLIIQAQKNQVSENVFWKNLARTLGLLNSRDLKKVWMQNFNKQSKLNKEVVSIIRKINRNLYRVCLLSNTTKFYRDASPYKKLLRELFSVIVCSCDFKTRKPDKKLFDIMLSKLKINPKHCLFIDDQWSSFEYPKKLGMNTILFKSPERLEFDLIKKKIL